jgi:CheY-like chemotaxis protein
VSSLRDITKERTAIKTAMKARAAALRASRTKSQFLANMSHEVRTPITAIMGFAELLGDEVHNPETRKYLGSIRKNSEHLRQVINDILDISSIESGKLKIAKQSRNIREVISEAFETMRVHAQDKGLDFQLFVGESVPESGLVDAVRVKQVLLNLIGNAIKFTDRGFVHVDAHLGNTGEKSQVLEIVISDSGCGISDKNARNLFTLFYQADAGTNRRFGGTGLGLAVSKNLAALMDGDVRLQRSKPDEGSEFVFTVQISGSGVQVATPKRRRLIQDTVPLPLRGLSILVVEDGEDIQLLLKSYLRKAGAVVDQAINGLEGYEKALEGNYDAVLMDIQMPIVDGLEATEMLRRKNYRNPIIAVSANAFPRDISLSLKAGCNDHISKPIQYDLLVNKLRTWTGVQHQQPNPPE